MKTINKTIFAVMVMATALFAFAYAEDESDEIGGTDVTGTWALPNSSVRLTFNDDGTWERAETLESGANVALKGEYEIYGDTVSLATITSAAVNADVQELEIGYGAVLWFNDGCLREVFEQPFEDPRAPLGTWLIYRAEVCPDSRKSKADMTQVGLDCVKVVREALTLSGNNTKEGKWQQEARVQSLFKQSWSKAKKSDTKSSGAWKMFESDFSTIGFSSGGKFSEKNVKFKYGYVGNFTDDGSELYLTRQSGEDSGYIKIED